MLCPCECISAVPRHASSQTRHSQRRNRLLFAVGALPFLHLKWGMRAVAFCRKQENIAMKKIKKYSAVLLSAVLALTGTPPFFAAAASDSPVTDMTAFYQNWKTRYVRQDLYTADEIRYYVYYSEDTYTGGDPSAGHSFRSTRLWHADRRFYGGLRQRSQGLV